MWYVRSWTVVPFIGVSLFSISLAISLAPPPLAFAEGAHGRVVAGEVVSVVGVVFLRSDRKADQGTQGASLHPVQPGDYVYNEDIINTSSSGRIKVLMKDKTIIDLGPSALFKVDHFNNRG